MFVNVFPLSGKEQPAGGLYYHKFFINHIFRCHLALSFNITHFSPRVVEASKWLKRLKSRKLSLRHRQEKARIGLNTKALVEGKNVIFGDNGHRQSRC